MQLVRMEQRDEDLLFGIYAEVYRRSFEQWGLGEKETDQILQLQYRAKAMSYRTRYSEAIDYVVDRDGIAVGWALVHEGPCFMSLIDLMILPNFQRQGLGTQVVRQLQMEAERLGLPIKLHVDITNSHVYTWYVRMGFEETDRTLTHCEMVWHPNEMSTLGCSSLCD